MSVVTDKEGLVVGVTYRSEEEHNRIKDILAQVKSELEAEQKS